MRWSHPRPRPCPHTKPRYLRPPRAFRTAIEPVADTPAEIQPAPPRPKSRQEPAVSLPAFDVRRKRPPVLSFLLRWETLRRGLRVVSLLALDFAGLFAAIYAALMLKALIRDGELAWHASYVETTDTIAFAYLVTVLLFARSGMYADRAQRPGLPRIVTSLFQVMVVALIFALVNGERYSSYYIFYGSLAFGIVSIGSLRWAYEAVTGMLLRAAGYRRRAVLVGSGKHIEDVAHALTDEVHAPVEMVGFISLTPRPDNGLPSLGAIEDLPEVLVAHRVQEVIIADPDFPQERAVELVDQCHQRGVTVRIAPSTMEILVHRAEFVPGTSVPLFELRPPVFDGVDYAVKRTFDFLISLALLIVLSPLLLAISAAVFVSSRGPVLYRSIRPGIGGAPFACFKFRTMRSDADQVQADLESLNEASGPLFKIRDDPRQTRVGSLLRRYSLDELPQLLNVLLGQMSLVGPRPLPQRDFDRLEEWHKKRYLVLPGITGLWQVSGRSELDFDDLVRLDFLYLERWSVGLDLSILIKTLPAVISRRGAF
jgi:exopolysaccharide biosynthesis polyprenyl glycosylphosphotransferase